MLTILRRKLAPFCLHFWGFFFFSVSEGYWIRTPGVVVTQYSVINHMDSSKTYEWNLFSEGLE